MAIEVIRNFFANIGIPWIQVSSATIELKAAISLAMASAGVFHPSVFLGLPFRSQATSFNQV
jgi:hypothetical protein